MLLPVPPERVRQGCHLIGVDGRSGTGKTTLAARLAQVLEPAGAPVVHLDDIYPGWDGLAAGIDMLVAGVLAPLSAGHDGRWRRWNWVRDEPGDWVEMAWAPAVVVEGAGAGARACRPYLSSLLWLHTDDATRYTRAITRDGAAFAAQWDRWAAQEAAYLASDEPRAHADVLVLT